MRIVHANFGINRINSLGARVASVRNEKNTASLPADAVMQMISLNFKLEYVLCLRALHTAEIDCPHIYSTATVVITKLLFQIL